MSNAPPRRISASRPARAVEPERRSQWLGVPALRSLLGWARGLPRAATLAVVALWVLTAMGVAALALLYAHERRAPEPMLPVRFFRNRTFSATNGVSFAMFFGTFNMVAGLMSLVLQLLLTGRLLRMFGVGSALFIVPTTAVSPSSMLRTVTRPSIGDVSRTFVRS